MPTKTDISAFKKPRPKEDMLLTTKATKKPAKRGPRPKPTAEKASVRIALNITPAEEKKLQKKAGIIPVATYLMHHLRENTDIFE